MEALGIEPKLLVAQIVNFFVIVIILNVLLYKPILSMLAKRKKEIEEGLKYTEKMRGENEKAEERKAAIMADARKEGQVIIEEARRNGKTEEKQILEEARRTADEIIEKGKISVREERESMQKNIKKEVVNLAILMAKRLLSETITQEMQQKILSKHIKEIERV